jgi:hypothetical protein
MAAYERRRPTCWPGWYIWPMQQLTRQQMEWLWRCQKPTKTIPLDVVQVLLRQELIGRTESGAVLVTESGRYLLNSGE